MIFNYNKYWPNYTRVVQKYTVLDLGDLILPNDDQIYENNFIPSPSKQSRGWLIESWVDVELGDYTMLFILPLLLPGFWNFVQKNL